MADRIPTPPVGMGPIAGVEWKLRMSVSNISSASRKGQSGSSHLRNSKAATTPPAIAPYAVRLIPFSNAVSHFSATLSSLVDMFTALLGRCRRLGDGRKVESE